MSNVTMTRKKLSDEIEKAKATLLVNLFMVTCFRATKDGSIQAEFCQNRKLGSSAITLLGLANRSDERFSDGTTLLYDWVKITPKDFLALCPNANITEQELMDIAESWDENQPTGKDAIVYPQLDIIEKMVDPNTGSELTPVITVREVTESELKNTFFKGEDADEKAEDVIARGKRVMRTGSDEDAEYLVHPESGEKIYRFTRTEFKEHGAKDSLIEGKMTESAFKSALRAKGAAIPGKNNLKSSILEQDNSIN